jgi:hypothetical protein
VWAEGEEVARVRFVREGTERRHALKAEVRGREGGARSGWWAKKTLKAGWSRQWAGWTAREGRMKTWEKETTAALGAWCFETLGRLQGLDGAGAG